MKHKHKISCYLLSPSSQALSYARCVHIHYPHNSPPTMKSAFTFITEIREADRDHAAWLSAHGKEQVPNFHSVLSNSQALSTASPSYQVSPVPAVCPFLQLTFLGIHYVPGPVLGTKAKLNFYGSWVSESASYWYWGEMKGAQFHLSLRGVGSRRKT